MSPGREAGREICGGEGGGSALALPCDITDSTAVLQLKRKVREKYPEGPHIIINNAAYGQKSQSYF